MSDAETGDLEAATAQSTAADCEATGHRVVVGVDGTPSSRRALAWAVDNAEVLGPVLPVAVYHLDVPRGPAGPATPSSGTAALLAEDAARTLRDSLPGDADDRQAAALIADSLIVAGEPGQTLVDVAADEAMLVVGAKAGRGLSEKLLGSVSIHCVTHSTVPVVVVPATNATARPLRRIVVGVDGSANAVAALRWALRHRPAEATVTALHCRPGDPDITAQGGDTATPSVDEVARIVAAVAAEGTATEGAEPAPVELHTVAGSARQALADAAADADLLVVGARGRRGAPYAALGSVATSLAQYPTVVTAVVPCRRAEASDPSVTPGSGAGSPDR